MMSLRFLVMTLFLSLLSCSAQDGIFNEMESAEEAAGERARKELVVYMSLETMFPDPQLRALAGAAGKGKVKQVEALIVQGVDVNGRGARNATPLFWAMRSSNIRGFRKLLELCADPNVVFDDGGTVMHWAVSHENDAFLEAALAQGGNPNLRSGGVFEDTPLFIALGDHSDKIDILLNAGADVNAQDKYGYTPAISAAAVGRFDVVYKLLNHGADYQIKTSRGRTLVDVIAGIQSRMDPKHELYAWMQKVFQWLADRGVHVTEETNGKEPP